MGTKKGPWEVVNSKTVYENPWINVREDAVIRPDKKDGTVGVVRMKHGVTVLPIDSEKNVYLTREYHYAVERETIEAISGGIDVGEHKTEAAMRELQEEAGIIADKLTDLGVIDPFTSVVVSPNYLFLAENLSFSEATPEGTEQITIIKVPLGEAVRMVTQSEITHGATVAVILKTNLLLTQ